MYEPWPSAEVTFSGGRRPDAGCRADARQRADEGQNPATEPMPAQERTKTNDNRLRRRRLDLPDSTRDLVHSDCGAKRRKDVTAGTWAPNLALGQLRGHTRRGRRDRFRLPGPRGHRIYSIFLGPLTIR